MKAPLYLLALAGMALLSQGNARAQQSPTTPATHVCGYDAYMQQQFQQHPGLKQSYDKFYQDAAQRSLTQPAGSANKTNATKRIIPIVFHIIHSGNSGNGNISRQRVLAQLDVINRDYLRTNPDTIKTLNIFRDRASSMDVEFRLATKDPDGNCTDGVTRTYSTIARNADNLAKKLVIWDPARYLNIWVVEEINSSSNGIGVGGVILGYAQFPSTGNNFVLTSNDGIVIRADRVNGDAATDINQDLGRTLTHEIGHWLGLAHPFQGGCTGGDGVADTPPVDAPNFGCGNLLVNSCNTDNNPANTPPSLDEPDMVQNYMDYANDVCMNLFSEGQRDLMLFTLDNYRTQLTSDENIAFTGTGDSLASRIGDPCLAQASFYSDSKYACVNDQVTFQNNTYNTGTGSVSYNWTFANGSPSTSTNENPTVTFNTPGRHLVTLTATSANGQTTTDTGSYVSIVNPANALATTWQEPFWDAPKFNREGWGFYSEGTTTLFRRTNLAGYNDIFSLFVPTDVGDQGNYFNAVTPALNLSTIPSGYTPVLSFRYSTAPRIIGNDLQSGNPVTSNDQVRIYVSTNCGQDWSVLPGGDLSGNTLNTLGTTIQNILFDFYPNDNTKWKQRSITLSSYVGATDLRIRFELRSRGGENLFLDDLQVGWALGVDDESIITADAMTLFPNPTNSATTLQYALTEASEVSVEIVDLQGRVVRSMEAGLQSAGTQRLTIGAGEDSLAPGLYLVRLTASGHTRSLPLSVAK